MRADRCSDRRILAVTGKDRKDFLQGLISNDVEKLSDGLVYAALLTPQGKYLADFLLVRAEDAIWLDVPEALMAGLIQRLGLYKLRSDVALAPVDVAVWRGTGPAPEGAYPDPRDARLGWRFYGALADAVPADEDWDALRVECGIPESGIELIPNESYLLEVGFERLNGVDFKKGCYVGQEVTARMKHKATLRKGLAIVEIDGKAPVGTEITAGGKAVGTVYTQSAGKALAYLRFDRAKGPLDADGVTLWFDAEPVE
ncbi:MAG: folate-binding protein [Pseudomonadota bacterium]